MIAYDETYLSGAQRRLGALYDFATYGLKLELAQVHAAFLASPLSWRFAAGDPATVAGRSGEELALEVLSSHETSAVLHKANDDSCKKDGSLRAQTKREAPSIQEWNPGESASPEYWTGWALAFYQWASGYDFAAIDKRIGIVNIRALYTPYHEMDVRQFCERLDELCAHSHPQTNLQDRRLAAGLSQRQLARASGVPVRTLQQYEQRQKNINHARADYVSALARVLGCNSADLFEHDAKSNIEYAVVRL